MNTTYMVCKSKHECNIIWLHRVLQRSAVECYDTLRPNVFQPEECKGVRGRGSDDGRWTWGMWSGGRVCSAEHVCNTYIHTHVCTCSETHSTTTLQETSAQSWVKHANYVQVTQNKTWRVRFTNSSHHHRGSFDIKNCCQDLLKTCNGNV